MPKSQGKPHTLNRELIYIFGSSHARPKRGCKSAFKKALEDNPKARSLRQADLTVEGIGGMQFTKAIREHLVHCLGGFLKTYSHILLICIMGTNDSRAGEKSINEFFKQLSTLMEVIKDEPRIFMFLPRLIPSLKTDFETQKIFRTVNHRARLLLAPIRNARAIGTTGEFLGPLYKNESDHTPVDLARYRQTRTLQSQLFVEDQIHLSKQGYELYMKALVEKLVLRPNRTEGGYCVGSDPACPVTDSPTNWRHRRNRLRRHSKKEARLRKQQDQDTD